MLNLGAVIAGSSVAQKIPPNGILTKKSPCTTVLACFSAVATSCVCLLSANSTRRSFGVLFTLAACSPLLIISTLKPCAVLHAPGGHTGVCCSALVVVSITASLLLVFKLLAKECVVTPANKTLQVKASE